MAEWNLSFMHPRYGTLFPASIDGNFSVGEMLENLVLTGFIPQRAEGYSMAQGAQLLSADLEFDQIPDLYDGAILRLIENEGDAPLPHSDDRATVILLHPDLPHSLRHEIAAEQTVGQVIEQLLARGFLVGNAAQFALSYKGTPLDAAQHWGDLIVQSGDFLQIIYLDPQKSPTLAAEIAQLKQELEAQSQGIFLQLQAIETQLPRPASLPLSATLQVQPTQVVYESWDALVQSIRQLDQLPPVRPIRATSLIPLFLLLALMVLSVLAGIFWESLSSLF